MTGSEYPHTADQVIRLCACAVKGSAPDPQWVAELDLERLYGAARFHQLTAAVGMALEAAGCAASECGRWLTTISSLTPSGPRTCGRS